MIKGFYTAGTGLLTSSRVLDTTANNIANAKTAGFKRDTVVTETFGERLAAKSDGGRPSGENILGSLSSGRIVGGVQTNFSGEGLLETGSAFDLAIDGEGFFTLETAAGRLYTRNGQFSLDAEGFIISSDGSRLVGQRGEINAGGVFEVTENGEVFTAAGLVDRILIYNPADTDGLVKQENGLFAETGNPPAADFKGTIRQGYIEASNVDLINEMMEMMRSQRSLQSCGQALKMIDNTLEKATQLGRMV